MRKKSYEDIKNYVLNNSECELLTTKEEFDNNNMTSHDKFKFKCSCGNVFKKRFYDFTKSNKCNECNGRKKYDIQDIKEYVLNNSECELLSTEYINYSEKLKFKCSCGNTFETTFGNFTNRNQRQCPKCGGKLRNKNTKLSYKEVKKFIEVDSNSGCKLLSKEYINNGELLKIQCKCGNIFETTFRNFKSKTKIACDECVGIINYSIQDIKDYVLNNSECELLSTEYVNNKQKLKFKCKCGNIFETSFHHFVTSNQKRCSICSKKMSKGEYITHNYLINKNIKFEEQKKFKNCKDKNMLPFDFYLPDYNTCIEIDGEGHYKPFKSKKYSEEYCIKKYNTQKKHDKIKDDYCKEYNIKLLRIPYWKFNNIENILEDSLI